MRDLYIAYLWAGAVLAAVSFLFGLAWFFALRRGWASLRLLTALLLATYAALGLGIWLTIHENWILAATAVVGLITAAVLLSMPWLNGKLMRALRMRW